MIISQTIICELHNMDANLICPLCNKFICSKCKDPHTNTGTILHLYQVEAIINTIYNQKTCSDYSQARKSLTNAFEAAVEYARKTFNQYINKDYVNVGSDEIAEIFSKLSQESKDAITNLASNYKDDITTSNNNQMKRKLMKGKNIVSVLRSITLILNEASIIYAMIMLLIIM